jgi:hypothetical protein
MPPLAKHAGTPDACPACALTLPRPAVMSALSEDTRRRIRDEMVWMHAVAQFADQSGVDVALHSRSDLELLIRAWSRSAAVVQLDAELHNLAYLSPAGSRPDDGFNRGQAFAMGGILTGIAVVFFIICSGIWRFFT